MSKTILVADDSKTIQQVVALTFRATDFKVVQVGDGDEALRRANELRPDIVLADVGMPGKSGYEVCSQLKSAAATRNIPVLLMAGAFEPFDDRRAQEAQADGHIKKPFDSQALIDRVRALTGDAIASELPMSFAASLAARQAASAAAQPASTSAQAGGVAPRPTLPSSPTLPRPPPPPPPPARGSPFSLPRAPVPPVSARDESRGLAADLGVPSPWSPATRTEPAAAARPPEPAPIAARSWNDEVPPTPMPAPRPSPFGPPFASPQHEARASETAPAHDEVSAWTKGRAEDVQIEEPEIIEEAEVVDESGMTLESTVPSLEPPERPAEVSARADVDVWSLAEAAEHGFPEEEAELAAPPAIEPTETEPDIWSVAEPEPPPPSSSQDIEAIEEIQIDEIPLETQPMVETVGEAMAEVAEIAELAAEPIAAQVEELVPGLPREELIAVAREVIERIAWEVVPELAETIIRAELDRLLRERE